MDENIAIDRISLQKLALVAAMVGAVGAGSWQVMHLSFELGRQSREVHNNMARSRANETTIAAITEKLSDRRVNLEHRLQRIQDQEQAMQEELQYLVKVNREARGLGAAAAPGPQGGEP